MTLHDSIDPFVTQKKFKGFEATFFYPSRGSGRTRVYYLKVSERLRLTYIYYLEARFG